MQIDKLKVEIVVAEVSKTLKIVVEAVVVGVVETGFLTALIHKTKTILITREDVVVAGAEMAIILTPSIHKTKTMVITSEDVVVVGAEMVTKTNKIMSEGPELKFKSNATISSRRSRRDSPTTRTLKKSFKTERSQSQIQ
jgi:hypothetical protein